MGDDPKLDELFRTGIKTTARPYQRAAVAHRDAMLSPTPKIKVRAVHRGLDFAAAHRRLIAVVSTAAALSGVAAYAVPNLQSAGRAKINPAPTATTKPNTNGSTPGRGTKPGGGVAPAGNGNRPAAVGVMVDANNPPYVSRGGETAGGAPGDGSNIGGTTGHTDPAGPVLDVTTPPAFSSPNHMLLVLDDSGFHKPARSVLEGVAQIGLQDARSNPVGIATVAIDGVIIKAGSYATLHLDDVDFPYIATAAVDDRAVGDVLKIYADVAALSQGADDQYVISVTLSHTGFSLDTRESRKGDEPYWTNDPSPTPPPGRLWTTVVLPSQQVPRLHVTVNDHLPHTFSVLTSTSTNKHDRSGDLSAKATHKEFSLPTQKKGAPYRKYVLQYDEPNGDTHTLVIWVIGK